MEWDAPAIILATAAYGEGDLLATVMTEAHGLHRGLARGGASRRHAALWQPGNLAQLRWVARLPEQLGSLTGELVHPGAALAMEDRLALAILSSACAVAEGALPDREPLPALFGGLLGLVAGLSDTAASLTALVRWELALLAGLGYGLDLSCCALSGAAEGLAWVSPRTGRAVADAAAGEWRPRLLALPAFLLAPRAVLAQDAAAAPGDPAPTATLDAAAPDATSWRDGLRLTGHFLARDAFGHTHRPLPPARERLLDLVAAMCPAPPPPPPAGR